MKKSVAGQHVGAQMITAADGSDFSGTVTVYVCGDGGTQAIGSVGSGICTLEGHGYYTYAPAQAETNYDVVAFTFTGTGAISATRELYTDFPQTGDSFARLGAPAGASVSADVAAVNAKTTNLPAAPASTTNITAGTITTVTNLTNAPTNGDLTATMKASVTTAATAATPTAAAVTGAVGSVTATVNADVKKINGTTVNGNGSSPTWGP